MVAGHFAFAAGVKAAKDTPPLWALMLATQFLDVIFIPLYLTGVETIATVGSGGYGNGIIHANYTHSLVGALVLSLVALAAGWRFWGRRAGWILAGVTFSHWLLDLLVHRADLPLLPGNWGNLPTLGLGLWQFPALTAGIELAMAIAGTLLYGISLYQATTHKGRAVFTASLMGVFLVGCLTFDWLGILG